MPWSWYVYSQQENIDQGDYFTTETELKYYFIKKKKAMISASQHWFSKTFEGIKKIFTVFIDLTS